MPFISKETLEDLYYKRKLSLKAIGIIYEINPSAVLRKMRKFHIALRKQWDHATINPKKLFAGSPEEKAYLIGFRLGDLGVKQKSNLTQSIIVKSNTTKLEQATLMKNLFAPYSDVWISGPNIKGVYHFTTLLHPSFDFLIPKSKRIPEWIENNTSLSFSFIAGYTDAEGSIGIYDGRARFRIGSYDIGILRQIHKIFKRLSIKSILRLEQKKGTVNRLGFALNGNFWRISINEKASLLKVFNLLLPYMKHRKRIGNLLEARNNIYARNHAIIHA